MRTLPFRFALLVLLTAPLHLNAQGEWAPEGATFMRPRLMITPQGVDTVWFSLQWARKDSDPQFRSMYKDMLDEALRELPPTDTLQTSSRRANARYAKNVAFVLTANRKPELWWAKPLDDSVRAELKSRLLLSLSRINPNVDDVLQYTEWQWRTKELIDYLCAYDMALGLWLQGPEMDDARSALQKFAGLLYREATREIAGQSFFTLVRNNHALMVCGALGAAAIVLNDAGSQTGVMRPANWMAAALYWSDDLLWRAEDRLAEPDRIAGYAEGPHYLRYALLNLLPFWRGLHNVYPVDTIEVEYRDATHRIPHPFTDTATRMLAEWARGIMTPDGLLPSIEDTFVDEAFPELALLDEERYFAPINSPYTTLEESLESTVDMRANYMATGLVVRYDDRPPRGESGPSLVRIYPAAGNASVQIPRLVESPEDVERTLHLGILGSNGRARTEGGGHNQSDAASFYLNYGQRRLALDPGYLSYARRDEVSGAQHHNMILVDGEGPPPGKVGQVGGADAYLSEVPTRWGEARGLLQLTVETSYLGADILRQFFAVDDSFVVIVDDVSSSTPHRYTWQVHGIDGRVDASDLIGSYSFSLDSNTARWIADSAALSVNILTSDPDAVLDTVGGVHEIGYEKEAKHTTLRSTTKEVQNARFLTVMHPTPDVDADVLSSRSESGMEIVVDDRFVWSIADVRGAAENRSFNVGTHTIETDADLVGFMLHPYRESQWTVLQQGTYLTVDGVDWVRFDSTNSIAMYHFWSSELVIDVARAGSLSVATGFYRLHMVSPRDGSARYRLDTLDTGERRLYITVDRPGEYRFQSTLGIESERTLPEELDLSRAE